ncbi:L-asparaginase [Chloroherpeton thalassium ATCC 35110]|uniref:L-asparaginase n=1 Tax=Chloroherpeton thalassium (strain ATCC 35110 / GB-78) TaxID=517418 RepID=B3QTH4_CHLT3|nr:asparaginase domain-containing protein [Chloroherpeton thalassium]ACF12720.1 L-asparaginase [Chloroherpeton thalassium ATCC 35110]
METKIKLFITGGTIDKKYNELDGSLGFHQTHFPAMLSQARNAASVTLDIILMKDSLEMNDTDRALICQKCLECEETLILISHGTDTMVETGKFLSQSLKGKTVVLFGAMIPYSFSTNTDALFNFGFALAAVQLAPSGVFIAMNGKLFNWDTVTKNKQKGVFQTVENA